MVQAEGVLMPPDGATADTEHDAVLVKMIEVGKVMVI